MGPALTYEALKQQVAVLMAELRGLGVRRGDRVAIVLPNGIEVIAAFLAVSSVATAAPLNAAYKPDEFKFYLDDTNACALIHGAGRRGGRGERGRLLARCISPSP